MASDMQRDWIAWSVDEYGRWIPKRELGKELKIDPRPNVMRVDAAPDQRQR